MFLLLTLALAGTPVPEPGSELFHSELYNIEPEPIVARPLLFGGEGADLGYSYIEAGFTTYNVNDLNDDNVDTYYGKLSWGLLKFFYLFGQYENQSTDFSNTRTNQVTIGGGAHIEPLSKLSFWGQIGWIYSSVSSDSSGLDGNETGHRIDGGVRWLALPWTGGGLELDGGIGYIDLKNQLASSDHPTVYDLGARVHFLSAFSVGATYERIDVDDRFIGDVRFSF